jgi:hypothetical protein
LVCGASGSGKTTLGAKFERPLFLATEVKGLERVAETNPNASIWTNAKGQPGIRSLTDLYSAVESLHHPRIGEFYDAVILDSLTEAQRLIKEALVVGEAKMAIKQWGAVIDKTAAFVRWLRDCPIHVLVIALDEEVNDGERVVHRPALLGKKLPNQIAQHFSIVGFAMRRQISVGEFRHEVMFQSDDRYITKGLPCLDAYEPPEPLYWLQKRFGGTLDDDTAARVEAWHAQVKSSD